ncbi:unnamed protein product, partial [Meganyctiphanes norvegica]
MHYVSLQGRHLLLAAFAGPGGQPECYCWPKGPAKDCSTNAESNWKNALMNDEIVYACCDGRTYKVEEWLSFPGSSVNAAKIETGQSLLAMACEHGREDMVRMLLRYRPHLNVQDYYGNTALMLAVKNGHLTIVKILTS